MLKWILVLLLIVLAVQMGTVCMAINISQRTVGDINHDGKVDALDMTALEIKIVEYYHGH